MTKELPFEHLVDTIKDYRHQLIKIMESEYSNIDNKNSNLSLESRIDKGSPVVQQKIFNRFHNELIHSEFNLFRDNYNSVIISRNIALKKYVKHSIDHIKNWDDNQDLLEAHFIHTHARNKKNGIVDYRITPVTDYYGEETLRMVTKEKPEEFIPLFDGKQIDKSTLENIELLSVSNITGLYDPNDLMKNSNIFDVLKYKIYSRVKTSERERDKFIDWVLGLRAENDFPYDSIGMIVVVPDDANSKINGSEIYKFRDHIVNFSGKYNGDAPKQKNVKSTSENDSSKVKKLLAEKYNVENYFSVMRQLKETNKDLDSRFKNKTPKLTEEEVAKLLQGIQIKHYYNDIRTETWVMNKEMYNSYSGKYIGHTSLYINDREEYRKEYLRNPAKTEFKKGRNTTEIEPNVELIAEYLKKVFRNVFKLKYD